MNDTHPHTIAVRVVIQVDGESRLSHANVAAVRRLTAVKGVVSTTIVGGECGAFVDVPNDNAVGTPAEAIR